MAKRRLTVPLVADIHFTPSVAMMVVEHVEKVRINPGNFADKKRFKVVEFSDAAYNAELERLYEKFSPLVRKCKDYGRAMRIGVNHGSLSDRIMNRYGDTIHGMVESALEFARICEDIGFYNVVFSMKSSNPVVMITAYRLLAKRLDALGMAYPFHLGVTEAGNGEDGRIKSAVGIGSLLEDGIGDTVRVSLTEDPEHEVPVAVDLVQKFNQRRQSDSTNPESRTITWDPYAFNRRESRLESLGALTVGGKEPIRVAAALDVERRADVLSTVDTLLQLLAGVGDTPPAEIISTAIRTPADLDTLRLLQHECATRNCSPIWKLVVSGHIDLARNALPHAHLLTYTPRHCQPQAQLGDHLDTLMAASHELSASLVWDLDAFARSYLAATQPATSDERRRHWQLLLDSILTAAQRHARSRMGFTLSGTCDIFDYRLLRTLLDERACRAPIHLQFPHTPGYDNPLLAQAAHLGSLLCDGLGDSLEIPPSGLGALSDLRLGYTILQATGLRIFKADFVSCPSCGRTQFDLQTTTARIKDKFGHLKGVKIAIMGCIVNGPGEMADAHFGYVGAGTKKIDLYVGKDCVTRGIDEGLADEKLKDLIAAHGVWVEPVRLTHA